MSSATSARRPLAGRLLRNPLGAVSLVYLVLLFLVAVVGPFLAPHAPDQVSLEAVLAPPSSDHLLGGDSAGRDVLSRLIAATGTSLLGALIAVVVAAIIGVTSGLIAGYRGGWFDQVSNWLASTTLSLPAIVVLLAVRSVVGPSIWWIMAIFGVILAPSYHRIVYGAVREVRAELYIDAAVVSGLSQPRIIGRHVLTAVRAPTILLTSSLFAVAIAVQASLDFLGVGDPSRPTWGSMLSDGFANISRTSGLMMWPSLVIALTCVALSLLSTALRDELEQQGDSGRGKSVAWSAPQLRPAPALVHGVAPSGTPAPQGAPLLEIKDLSIAYRVGDGWKTVVDGTSLTVGQGEVHALIGESGSGKTQTAWSTLGLLPPGGFVVGGSIRFNGKELTELSAKEFDAVRGRDIAYVPQEPLSNLDPSFTIGHQLSEPLRFTRGFTRKQAQERALELLERVGIRDPQRIFSSYPHQISGGMAQRVLIAGAVASQPKLIIADEPTTALDVTVQAEILELLRDLQRETGVSILLVTHNFGVVADLADRVSVMRSGSIVETGSVAQVFAHPAHEYTRGLMSALLDNAPARGALRTELA